MGEGNHYSGSGLDDSPRPTLVMCEILEAFDHTPSGELIAMEAGLARLWASRGRVKIMDEPTCKGMDAPPRDKAIRKARNK